MKRILLYTVLFLLLCCISSCLDDKNDFNYRQINELNGSIENMNGWYTVSVEEDLYLKPTFKFTIDSIHPDVSYEWYLDGELLDVKTPDYTFNAAKTGKYEVTYSVVDNKTGVKFSKSAEITVRSPYLVGWLILSEKDGKSALSFIKMRTVKRDDIDAEGNPVERDSIIFYDVEKYFRPDLGTEPKGLMEHIGVEYDFGFSDAVYDEIVVMQGKDNWVELNGNTMEHEVYTKEEFGNDLPENFEPVEAAMTFSSKLIRDKNGFIYLHRKVLANDYHAGSYISVPLANSTKFKGLYQAHKLYNRNYYVIPACTEDNSLVGIWDAGRYNEYSLDGTPSAITENSSRNDGNIVELTENTDEKHFKQMSKNVIAMIPATCGRDNRFDVTDSYIVPKWLALMEEKGTYSMRYFGLEGDTSGGIVTVTDFKEVPVDARVFAAGYVDMAVFQHKKYVVFASGKEIWYYPYGGSTSNAVLLKKFDQNIVSISSHDVEEYTRDGDIYHNGHLGVALENGDFFIYEVVEEDKVLDNITVNQLYPSPETEDKDNNNFGKIVDTLYKFGNSSGVFTYTFQ